MSDHHPLLELSPEEIAKVGEFMHLSTKDSSNFAAFLQALLRCIVKEDATLVEINPWTILGNGTIVCLDSKMNIDDNALFRQKETYQQLDFGHMSAPERECYKRDISYVALDGNIGCLVNGAGLAMATLDLIKLKGGSPANFLDIGGSATADQVEFALQLMGSDDKTKVIYVNIFGGIMRCDTIATGIVRAVGKFRREIPVVVRLKGTVVSN